MSRAAAFIRKSQGDEDDVSLTLQRDRVGDLVRETLPVGVVARFDLPGERPERGLLPVRRSLSRPISPSSSARTSSGSNRYSIIDRGDRHPPSWRTISASTLWRYSMCEAK